MERPNRGAWSDAGCRCRRPFEGRRVGRRWRTSDGTVCNSGQPLRGGQAADSSHMGTYQLSTAFLHLTLYEKCIWWRRRSIAQHGYCQMFTQSNGESIPKRRSIANEAVSNIFESNWKWQSNWFRQATRNRNIHPTEKIVYLKLAMQDKINIGAASRRT